MSQNLLVTKLLVPLARKNLVSRPRLINMLEEGWQQGRKLTLVSAPAGYGKTTLVAEWLRGKPEQTTWLSLDKTDNDPARFLTYLIAALQKIDGTIGETTHELLQSPQPLPPTVLLTTLINEIAALSTSFILVLEDYHAIDAKSIHQQLDFLVDNQPPQMHLAIITREDPTLPLPRLRARGHMVEIRQADLRFTLDECIDFLQRIMGLNLSTQDITILELRTEGWIAGLQLAALSMQACDDLPGFIRSFSGSSHNVLEYLIEEVFERQPTEEQEFLLKTSILDRLSGSLCDAVVNRSGSSLILDRLEHANLFIVPLDQSRTWYRYHQLFAELLRQRLLFADKPAQKELHRRASQWFASEGLIPEAIQHAMAAGEWEMVAELLGKVFDRTFRNGELATFLGWMKSLPDQVIFKRPELCRDYALALTATGQLDAAEIYLSRAESAVQDDPTLLGSILVTRAYYLRIRGDIPQAIDCARRALAVLPQTDVFSRCQAAIFLGMAYCNYGNFQEAERALEEGELTAHLSDNRYARMTALAFLGAIQGVYGRLHRAVELCQQAIHIAGKSPTGAYAHIVLGTLFYEWGELESAAEHLQTGVEQGKLLSNPLIESDGYIALAILQQGRGDPDATSAALQSADQIDDNRLNTPIGHMHTAASHVKIALAQGDLITAQLWAEQVTEPIDSSFLYPALGLTPVRVLLARGEKSKAAEKLKELYEIAHEKGWGAGLIEVRLLQALAAATPEDALHFLQDALQMAQPERFIRTFVDKGEPMKALLERLKPRSGELKKYILTLLASFAQTGSDYIHQPVTDSVTASRPGYYLERLSKREIEVLRLMGDGCANKEIAAQLVISVGTVKRHIIHIFRKLDAANRTQAVAIGRDLEII
jgi:LuxR family maltose regulon positive regulatory protein